jgi:hypothetical protein
MASKFKIAANYPVKSHQLNLNETGTCRNTIFKQKSHSTTTFKVNSESEAEHTPYLFVNIFRLAFSFSCEKYNILLR